MIKIFFNNVLAGTRTALFMPVQLWSFRGGFLQVCLLFLLSLALTFLYDYHSTRPDHFFNPAGISYQGLLYFLFFFSLTLIAVINHRTKDLDKLVVMFLSIVPVIWMGTLTLFYLSEKQRWLEPYQAGWLVFAIYAIWYLLVAGRIFKRFFYRPYTLVIPMVAIYSLINFLPLFTMPVTPLWIAIELGYSQNARSRHVDIESAYYAQRDLLKSTHEGLYASSDKYADLFFLGFAGYANEDVFMNEVLSAERIIQHSYANYGHSSVLINNVKTMDKHPLANKYNLESVLMNMGEKMDNEDILFLFISSHGSETHEISTSFYPFRFDKLDSDILHKLLEQADIPWRIIVVSACYSGGFIEKLSGPRTLLITAARHDRNSFGCGHDGRYTFFGEAFFEQGLKQGLKLEEAFSHATERIKEKEQQQGFTFSEPQWRIGEEMRDKLERFEKQIEERRQQNWAATSAF